MNGATFLRRYLVAAMLLAIPFSLAYTLTTGANWAGPIGTFHLTMDGVKPAWRGAGVVETMSLCSEIALQRTGKLRLESTVQNNTPKNDLRVKW